MIYARICKLNWTFRICSEVSSFIWNSWWNFQFDLEIQGVVFDLEYQDLLWNIQFDLEFRGLWWNFQFDLESEEMRWNFQVESVML